jgi:tetratricopeptide (TPR) repeat protein
VFDNSEKRTEINEWFRQERFPEDIDEHYFSDFFVHRIYSIGLRYPFLATLFSNSAHSKLKIPEYTSTYTSLHTRIWRGAMFLERAGGERGESDFDRAKKEYEDLLELVDSNPRLEDHQIEVVRSLCYGNLAVLNRINGNFKMARDQLRESLEIDQELGNIWGIATTLSTLGDVEQQLGNPNKSEEYYKRSIKIDRQLEDHYSWAKTIGSLSSLYLMKGELELAENLNEIALGKFKEFGDEVAQARALGRAANIAELRGDREESRELLDESVKLRQFAGDRQAEAEHG